MSASAIPIEVRVIDVVVFRPVERGWQALALRRRAGTRCPGSWEMVHGKVMDGESLPDAAVRDEHDKHAWLTISQARRRYSWPHERRHLDDAYALLRTPEVHDVLTVPLG